MATLIGSEFQDSTATTADQRYPAIAVFADGSYVIAWQGDELDGSGIYTQCYGHDNQPVGSRFWVNTYITYEQVEPVIATFADGSFVIAWKGFKRQGSDLYAQRYNSNGQPSGHTIQVNTATICGHIEPVIVTFADHSFVISWISDKCDNCSDDGCRICDYGVYAQRYSSDGKRLGSEFRINTDNSTKRSKPAIARFE